MQEKLDNDEADKLRIMMMQMSDPYYEILIICLLNNDYHLQSYVIYTLPSINLNEKERELLKRMERIFMLIVSN